MAGVHLLSWEGVAHRGRTPSGTPCAPCPAVTAAPAQSPEPASVPVQPVKEPAAKFTLDDTDP